MWRIVLIVLAFALASCESAKYYECLARDSTSNPCN